MLRPTTTDFVLFDDVTGCGADVVLAVPPEGDGEGGVDGGGGGGGDGSCGLTCGLEVGRVVRFCMLTIGVDTRTVCVPFVGVTVVKSPLTPPAALKKL